MLYEDQTEQLIGGLFAVQNEVRTGKGEENYHQAYKIWLEENDIPYTSKKDHPVVLNRKVVHTLQPDIVVWDSIIIELKAKSRRLIDGDFIQLFEYLKYRGDRLGLLRRRGQRVLHLGLWIEPAPRQREHARGLRVRRCAR